MPRARKRASAAKAKSAKTRSARSTTSRATAAKTRSARARTSASASSEFVCPECGRSFSRAAALGAHRSRVHGVPGRSAQTKQNRASTGRTSTAKTAATTRRGASQTRARGTRQTSTASRDGINRDQLLHLLFPAGMPAREDVIRAVSGWLEDAERLARLR